MADPHDLAHDPDFQRYVYKILTFGSIALLAIGTVVFSALEDWSYVDSFYFSVVTATTVGFGDFTLETDGAKLLTVLYIVFGISIIGTYLDARLKKHAYGRSSRAESGLDN